MKMNEIIVRITDCGYTKTYSGTIEEIARYFKVSAQTKEELVDKIGNWRSYKVTLAKRISKTNIDVAEELLKIELKQQEQERLMKEQEQKTQFHEKLSKAQNVQAVTEVMPGLFEVKFVVSQISDEILDYLRNNKYILKLDYLQAQISNIDEALSVNKVYDGYEYDGNEYYLKIGQEYDLFSEVKMVSEYIYEF